VFRLSVGEPFDERHQTLYHESSSRRFKKEMDKALRWKPAHEKTKLGTAVPAVTVGERC